MFFSVCALGFRQYHAMLDWCTELRNTLKQDKQNGAAMLVPDAEDPMMKELKTWLQGSQCISQLAGMNVMHMPTAPYILEMQRYITLFSNLLPCRTGKFVDAALEESTGTLVREQATRQTLQQVWS